MAQYASENSQGIQGESRRCTLPEADGSGRGLKISSKSAIGSRELRSVERQGARVKKDEKKVRKTESQTSISI